MDLQFIPFQSRINPDFWLYFSKLKLEAMKLKKEPFRLRGRIEFTSKSLNLAPVMDLDRFSLDDSLEADFCSSITPGVIVNENTIEDFRNLDKSALMNEIWGTKLRQSFMDGSALKLPELYLNPFLVLTYADLKNYNYYFWFAFPAFQLLPEIKIKAVQSASEFLKPNEQVPPYFAFVNGDLCTDLKMAIQSFHENNDVMFGFIDSCTYESFPGWTMRNFLALILSKITQKKVLKFFSYRRRTDSKLFILEYQSHENKYVGYSPGKLIGWEKNENGKLGPRVACMKNILDPRILSESSIDFNLKLMKWRILPQLSLESLAQTKVLLLGAGTLGCNVARCCLSWGIRNITFVDSAKVSFSNPVRQSLFEYEDCLDGGKHKAECASQKLTSIFPGVTSCWYDISIPMPGHSVGNSLPDSTKKNIRDLDALVQNHDVIFLLTDSRESRWLPTVMGAYHKKIVMNAALGFDSFLVIRHGMRPSSKCQVPLSSEISGDGLGCYFCNDIVAPGDSLKDRTLDQQCSVTRPGMSFLASAYVVELCVSLLQHPERGFASSFIGVSQSRDHDGILGCVPHSIRGSLSSFSQFTPTTPAFNQCTACSKSILKLFSEDKFELVKNVCNSSSILEELTGLSTLLLNSDLSDVIAISSDSEED